MEKLTLAQIAKAVGKARSTVGEWMRMVRISGLERLLALHQGRGRAPQLKANQGTAHAEIKAYLEEVIVAWCAELAFSEHLYKGHGRLETRRYWQSA